ncbi:hypothetical protein ACFCYH_03690 [Streptomyces sp. NPDC056400]|uniref:hypothetical protein n=1 Tax=Streptomyces sp. NPDC056400 TaxID=3345808 RepID=UPI0035D5BED7
MVVAAFVPVEEFRAPRFDLGGEVLGVGPFAWLPGEPLPVVDVDVDVDVDAGAGAGAGRALAAGAELLVVATKMLAAMPARGTTIPATHQAQRGGPELGSSAGTVGA